MKSDLPPISPSSSSTRTPVKRKGSASKKGDEEAPKTLTRYHSKLERSFVVDLFNNPDQARSHVLERCDIMADICMLLNAWAKMEATYGTSLDKIIVSANDLNSLNGASGTVSAIAAVVGSFQSLGKHHLGLQQCILSQINNRLLNLSKEQKKEISELTVNQVQLQKEASQLRSGLSKTKESTTAGSDSSAIHQASVKYDKQTKLQKAGLRSYLSNLYSIWLTRDETLKACLGAITETDQHILDFSDEVVKALESIVGSINIEAELSRDVSSIITNLEVEPGQDGGSLAGVVYEALGHVEPDVASSSVDAAVTVCGNSITICKVAHSVSKDLSVALDQRAKDMDSLASGLQLQHLKVSCEYGDVFSEEQTRETERQAWRMFMVTAKQSSMVLADFSFKLSRCAEKFDHLVTLHEGAKKQMLAARGAAHKELQLVAQTLKDARARLEACDDSIVKSVQGIEKSQTELAELEVKLEKKGRANSPSIDHRDSTSSLDDNTSAEEATEKSGPNVVQRLFGLSSSSLGEQIVEKKDAIAKAEEKLGTLRDQRNTSRKEFQTSSERLESQIQAYAVQIAGTVSGFVSVHAARVRELKRTLETLVNGTVEYNSTIRQLQTKMTTDLGKIDPFKDIEWFVERTKANPVQSPEAMIHVPIQLMSSASGDDLEDAEDDSKLPSTLPISATTPRHPESKVSVKNNDLAEFGLENETIIESFSCAYLPGKVPQQGRLILTKRFLCFTTLSIYEPMFGSCKVVVEFKDVEKVTKAASAWGLVANSLVVALVPLQDGQEKTELFFTSLFYRDKCYQQLKQLSSVNRDLKTQQGEVENGGGLWRSMDPRLGDEYKGNNLVIQLADSQSGKKKRNSGFLRLGLSSTDFAKLTEELEEKEETKKLHSSTKATVELLQTSKEKVKLEENTGGVGPYSVPCVSCKKPPKMTAPCGCWKPAENVRIPKDHKAVSTSFWRGSLESNICSLWLASTEIGAQNGVDIAKKLGEKLGDYDQEFTAFAHGKPKDVAFSRQGYTDVKYIYEDGETDNDSIVYRVVSFSHPIGNMAFGKQVAKSTQLQHIRGLDSQSNTVKPTGVSVVLNCDTALCGFPYADSFVVRGRFVLTPMVKENGTKTHVDEFWCKLEATVRVVWLKSVSVPFLKGKIEKENLQTGKKNGVEWEKLARATTTLTKADSAAEQKEGEMIVEEEESGEVEHEELINWTELMDVEFYRQAWIKADNTQKVQLQLLIVILLLQLWGFLFK